LDLRPRLAPAPLPFQLPRAVSKNPTHVSLIPVVLKFHDRLGIPPL
jgi:hypothetical protein